MMGFGGWGEGMIGFGWDLSRGKRRGEKEGFPTLLNIGEGVFLGKLRGVMEVI